MLDWVIKQLFDACLEIVKTIAARCCGRPDTLLPSAEGSSVTGRPQHQGATVLTIVQTGIK